MSNALYEDDDDDDAAKDVLKGTATARARAGVQYRAGHLNRELPVSTKSKRGREGGREANEEWKWAAIRPRHRSFLHLLLIGSSFLIKETFRRVEVDRAIEADCRGLPDSSRRGASSAFINLGWIACALRMIPHRQSGFPPAGHLS